MGHEKQETIEELLDLAIEVERIEQRMVTEMKEDMWARVIFLADFRDFVSGLRQKILLKIKGDDKPK